MKVLFYYARCIRTLLPQDVCLAISTVAIFLLMAPWAEAQTDRVTISAAEFQRLVYAAQLLSHTMEKPELETGLAVLLELQRRNPGANPAALAELSRQALQRYRTAAPAHIRTGGYRDEVMAAYLEAMRAVPDRTNFTLPNLKMLSELMLSQDAYTNGSPAELVHSSNQRLLTSAGTLERRRQTVDTCTKYAQSRPGFAQCMDALLFPETLVALSDSAAAIIENTNSPLHGNTTFETLLTLAGQNRSLTVSSNQLFQLFKAESDTLWGLIETNLARRQEFNLTHPDLLTYLTNQPLVQADTARNEVIRRGQAQQLACASAAILVQSKLVEAREPLVALPYGTKELGDGLCAMADAIGGIMTMDPGDIVSGAINLFNVMTLQESADDQMVREIGNVKLLIGDLSANMNYRFDRVDQSLVTIFNTLNEEFDKIEFALDAQNRRIVRLTEDVHQIQRHLLEVQADIHRLERNVLSYLVELDNRGFKTELNRYLGYESKFGMPMSYNTLPVPYYVYGETEFFTHARDRAVDGLSSPYLGRDYSASGLLHELTESAGSGGTVSNRLDQNLSYLKKFLKDTLHQDTVGALGQIANPRDWFMGAFAYAQLALENPMHFRKVHPGAGLDLVTGRGTELEAYLRSLVFNGTNLNWPLQEAVQQYYVDKMTNFTDAARAFEQEYSRQHYFPLDRWRNWASAIPRVPASMTKVLVLPEGWAVARQGGISASASHFLALQADGTVVTHLFLGIDMPSALVPPGISNVIGIASGEYYDLVLNRDGTVMAWGPDYAGEGTNVPPGLGPVLAIAAGPAHSLALKANGTVVGWGANDGGQVSIPPELTNVLAIAAGDTHSLALLADHTVVGWGGNDKGQANGVAAGADVVAIAAGSFHNLALKSDGSVVGWGATDYNQTTIPDEVTNVIAIAAGERHSVALRADGAVVAWGGNNDGETNTPAGLKDVVAIAAGPGFTLAIQADGEVIGWGRHFFGHTPVPPAATNVVAIASGNNHNLAVRSDGRVVAWGANSDNQVGPIPASATNVVAVAGGFRHSLALRADGTVVGWGNNQYGQANGAAAGGNIVAIDAGSNHGLALRADGRVTVWGYPYNGLLNVPAIATNVVSIAAGSSYNLALRADGTVVGWGFNMRGEATGTPTPDYPWVGSGLVTLNGQVLDNVVAIAGGGTYSLALKADGSVVGWGQNSYDQAGGAPAGSGIVALSAGYYHSLGLRGDGTVAVWGDQAPPPAAATNVIAVSAGQYQSVYLTLTGLPDAATEQQMFTGRTTIPARVRSSLQEIYGCLFTNLDLDLHQPAVEMSGAKALLAAVAELSLPHTLERDDILRGFMYGSESLSDLDACREFLQDQRAELDHNWGGGPLPLADVSVRRYLCFVERFQARLNDLQREGQPEMPRMLDHTLRLLALLRDSFGASAAPAPAPPPVLEISDRGTARWLTLYGEPYVHYSLQFSGDLKAPTWGPTTVTNLHNEQVIAPPVSGPPQRFFRALVAAQ